MPEISIIIPIYNANKGYLEKAADSALSQTFKDIEVIAVNDGSVNGCEEVIRERLGDERLKLITQENAGTSAARNAGLDAARGRYVLFLDADDYMEKDCCERVIEAARFFEKGDGGALGEDKGGLGSVDIIFFGYATEYTNRQVKRLLDDEAVNDSSLWQREALELAILRGDLRLKAVEIGAPWGKLIRRDAIESGRVRYTPGLVKGQDTVFILNLIEKCSSFKYFKYLGYHYRISEASISHRFNPGIVDIMEKTLRAYESFVSDNKKGEEFKRAVSRKYYRVLTGEYMELFFVNRRNKEAERTRRKAFLALCESEKYSRAIESMEGGKLGFFDALIFNAIRKRNIGAVFTLKRLEMLLKRFIVRQYG